MIHSTGSIQAEEENRYKAVAHYLLPRIREDESIFVWGYTNVMSWYMGEENEIVGGFNSSGFSGDYLDADYIVVDPLMVSKWPDDPLKAYLEDSEATYIEHAVGGFKLYTRRERPGARHFEEGFHSKNAFQIALGVEKGSLFGSAWHLSRSF
jgi:hypothetical protein